jgi:hypothetical protein
MGKYDTMVNASLIARGKEAAIQLPRDLYFSYPQKQVDLNPNLDNSDRRP